MKLTYLILILIFAENFEAQIIKDCSTCSVKIIRSEQIKNLSIDEVRLLTNEIFARNGYQFENGRFTDYFESKKWYQSKRDNKKVTFNETEKKNIKFFQDETVQLETNRKEIILQIKNFKNLVLTNNTSALKTVFNFEYEKGNGNYELKYLKEVLNKIDLNDINYHKNIGLNAVTTDNGFVQIKYEISLEGNEVRINYNWMTHSSIIKKLDEFTDYHSENEFSYEWQFILESKKIKFVRLAVAG